MKIMIVSHIETSTISRHIVLDSMTSEKAVLLGYASPHDHLFITENYAINVATFTVRPIVRINVFRSAAERWLIDRHQAVLDSPHTRRALKSFKKHNLLTFKPGENSNG